MNVRTSIALREDDTTSSSTCAPWTSATLSRQPNGCAHSTGTGRVGQRGPDHATRARPQARRTTPAGRLIEIPDGYTLIPEEQPDELARIIREFVRDTP
jgi:hypothetical protein